MKTLALISVFASGALMTQGVAAAESPMSSEYLLRLVFGLALIVALIFILAKFATRLNVTQGGNNGVLKIIAGMPTGARDRIVLLQVGEEQILVGLTPGRIEKIHTLAVPVESNEDSVVTGSFARKLKAVVEGGKRS